MLRELLDEQRHIESPPTANDAKHDARGAAETACSGWSDHSGGPVIVDVRRPSEVGAC